jgi:hypothetical protein
MTPASGEVDVLTKSDVVGVVMRKVEEKPPPPWVEIVHEGGRDRARRMPVSIWEPGGMASSLLDCL